MTSRGLFNKNPKHLRRQGWRHLKEVRLEPPHWIWLSAVFYAYSGACAGFLVPLWTFSSAPLAANRVDYLSQVPDWTYWAVASMTALGLLAAVLLFLRKKAALYFYGLAWAINFAVTGWCFFTTPLRQALGTGGGLTLVTLILLALVVGIYTRGLVTRGQLH